jgi:predicted ATPase with chaperone activity
LVALVGGGAVPTPGEISLAHHGVLFLDELPEFDRETLESLREPRQRQHTCNGNLDPAGVDRFCVATSDAEDILDWEVQRFRLSARAYHRLLKVARTIADLEGIEQITAAHISEALLFRQMDISPFPSPKGEGKDRGI